VGAIILTGADPAFCAGFDLRALSTELRSVQQNRQRSPLQHLGLMPEHDTPVIGAINGATVTGGLELAMCCDFLIASERARFADTHARVGAMPGGGMTIRLPQLIGIDRARRMSFTGDFIDAQTACEWGLVTEVVPHESLLDRARQIASTIAALPAANVREVRRMYRDIGELVGREAWVAESKDSRQWMETRFDQTRLATEREAIIARGRSQSTGGDQGRA
jgi:enoyl-CoA hydratase